jgi:hypothetical protein
MLKDEDLSYTYDVNSPGIALAWVIEEDVLYDAPLSHELGKMFLDTTRTEDISHEYPEHTGITVRMFKNDDILEELQTSEYFGSILLSNPMVVNLDNHKNGAFVIAPNAKFINYEFVVDEEFNPTNLDPWHPHSAPENEAISLCTAHCNCGLN